MEKLINWFEIPATNFKRAVDFYENLFGYKLKIFESETEKMAFFPEAELEVSGMISEAKGFIPSSDGIVIYFEATNIIDELVSKVKTFGGEVLVNKCKINAEGRGHFALLKDTEGNRIGFYSAT